MHSMHLLHRCFTVLAAVACLSAFTTPALQARPAAISPVTPSPPLPEQAGPITTGVVFAYGNELVPPYTVAVEDHMLCVYDGSGRRFVGGTSPKPVPQPRLHPKTEDGADVAFLDPAIAAAQITHLLSRGGLIALGRSYLRAFPPTTALTVLERVRWVVQHASENTLATPPGDTFLGDLLHPAPLPPPGSPLVGMTS